MQKYFNFIHVKSHGFVFAYIPKVACTNWKCLFRYMLGNTDYLDARKAHDRDLSGLSFLSNAENPGKILGDEDTSKFCFVRNPYSRVLSAYLDKVKPFAIDNAPEVRSPHFYQMFRAMDKFRLQILPEEKSVNLFTFLNWIRSSGHMHAANHHWIPQNQILYLDEIQFDFIGRFEKIDEDANHLLELMGCDLKFPSQKKVNFTPTGAEKIIREYYSEREIRLVKEIYSRDFELLDYPISFRN